MIDMIQQETLHFFSDLRENNHKDWFDANRKRYDFARQNIIAVTANLIEELSLIDESIGKANLQPSKCLTRINRDIRFSQDKSPYKPMMVITLGARKEHIASSCYFLFVEPGNIFCGGGAHHPENEHLLKIRQEISYEYEEWKGILNNAQFKASFPEGLRQGDKLSRVPKGFEKEHPAAEFLKLKGFIATQTIADQDISKPSIKEEIIESFKAVKPLVEFINRAIYTVS